MFYFPNVVIIMLLISRCSFLYKHTRDLVNTCWRGCCFSYFISHEIKYAIFKALPNTNDEKASVCVCVCALPTLKYVWAGHINLDLMLGSARFQSCFNTCCCWGDFAVLVILACGNYPVLVSGMEFHIDFLAFQLCLNCMAPLFKLLR